MTLYRLTRCFLPAEHVRVPTPLVATPSGSCVKLLREITCHLGLLLITRDGFFGNALHIVARPGTRERFCGPSGVLFEAYLHKQE